MEPATNPPPKARPHDWEHGPGRHPSLDARCRACSLEQHDLSPSGRTQRVEYRRPETGFKSLVLPACHRLPSSPA